MSVKYAYGYIRVSTHDQEEISPDSQEHLLRDYAARNNIVILKIFTDLGISGRKANKRPGFQEMIGLAKGDDHPVDQILVWKFSRFARNQEESIVYKSLLKKQHNVDVVSTKNKYRAGRKLIPCRHDMNFFFVLKTVPYNYAGIQCKTSAIQ